MRQRSAGKNNVTMLDFTQLQKLAVHATKPGAAFYRKLYGIKDGAPPLVLDTLLQWHALPFVTKDSLIDMPMAERSFLPIEQLDHVRASSGTSGKAPLFSPRTHVRNMEYRLRYHDFKKPFMSFTVPLMPYWHEQFQKEHGGSPLVVVYDPKNPELSVRIAKAAGIDAVSLFIHHAQAAAAELKRQGIHEQIRFLEITGETCSLTLYRYLRETFPQATIVQSYGASEVEDVHIGMPCKPLDGTEPLSVYHPKDTHYLEIVDPSTGEVLEPKKDVEGDLLISAYPGEPSAFPLLRMRIGDTVRVVEEVCPHGSWSFTVLGRTDMDFVKIAGGVLKADEVSRVLRLFPNETSDRYVLHCYTVDTSTGPLFKPVLELEIKQNASPEALAEKIAEELRVAPSFTYADGVAEKRYLPLTCTQKDTTVQAKKQLRIVVHS